jgi:transposase
VRRLVNAWRADPHHHGNQPTIAAPLAKEEATAYSARKTRWLLWKPSSDLTDSQARYVAALTSRCAQIADAHKVLERFRAIVSERQVDQLEPWLEQCERSGISELVGFAQGLRRDYAAVKAALRYEWSQGPVEGHVNRLKTIKRQMYGRAGFVLLRRRILTHRSRAP